MSKFSNTKREIQEMCKTLLRKGMFYKYIRYLPDSVQEIKKFDEKSPVKYEEFFDGLRNPQIGESNMPIEEIVLVLPFLIMELNKSFYIGNFFEDEEGIKNYRENLKRFYGYPELDLFALAFRRRIFEFVDLSDDCILLSSDLAEILVERYHSTQDESVKASIQLFFAEYGYTLEEVLKELDKT